MFLTVSYQIYVRILNDLLECGIVFDEFPLRIQVIMRNLTTEEVSVFTYEDWLSRLHGPKRTMICEMAAVVDEEMMVELTTYTIQVKTSDCAGQSAFLFFLIFLSKNSGYVFMYFYIYIITFIVCKAVVPNILACDSLKQSDVYGWFII